MGVQWKPMVIHRALANLASRVGELVVRAATPCYSFAHPAKPRTMTTACLSSNVHSFIICCCPALYGTGYPYSPGCEFDHIPTLAFRKYCGDAGLRSRRSAERAAVFYGRSADPSMGRSLCRTPTAFPVSMRRYRAASARSPASARPAQRLSITVPTRADERAVQVTSWSAFVKRHLEVSTRQRGQLRCAAVLHERRQQCGSRVVGRRKRRAYHDLSKGATPILTVNASSPVSGAARCRSSRPSIRATPLGSIC